jgi:hypothetical protein
MNTKQCTTAADRIETAILMSIPGIIKDFVQHYGKFRQDNPEIGKMRGIADYKIGSFLVKRINQLGDLSEDERRALLNINNGDCHVAALAIGLTVYGLYNIPVSFCNNYHHGWFVALGRHFDTLTPNGVEGLFKMLGHEEGRINRFFTRSWSAEQYIQEWVPYDNYGKRLIREFLAKYGVVPSGMLDHVPEHD